LKQITITGPLRFETAEVPVPEPGAGEALIKMDCLGVCGSDMQIYHGKHKFMTFPVILGHEIAATVAALGSGVTDFSAGDKVTLEPQVYCGECYPCKTGRFNVCERLKVMGVHIDGCAREFIAVKAAYLHKAPATMAPELLAMVEPFAVGVGSAKRSPRLQGGNVVVVGAGTIGNFTAQAAKALGAAQVMVTDINAKKLSYAAECGADYSVDTRNVSLKEAIAQAFGSRKADVIIDCAATGFTFKSILEAARPCSDIVITGNFKEPVEFNVPLLQRQEITMIGHMMYVREDFRTAIDLLSSGKIVTNKTVTAVFPFEKYAEAFAFADKDPDAVMKLLVSF